jgi:two-component system chemotaxis sensor kinase CheA
MAKDPYRYFRPEARDLIDQCAKGVLELEKGAGGTQAVQGLLRLAHTLKGAARVVKQTEIADRAHAIEDVLSPYRDVARNVARDEIDAVLEHLDAISGQLVLLEQADGAGPSSGSRLETEKAPRTVRTDIAETDAVLDGIAEAHTLLGGLRRVARGIEQAQRHSDLLLAQFAKTASADQGRASAFSVQRAAMADDFRRKLSGVERDLGITIDQLERELRQLRESAERLRLVSAGDIFTALERIARDTALAQSKQVVFVGRGGDIRLDSHVLEILQGALIQIIRNAVAHGIEPVAERMGAGKPAAGRVCVDVARRGRGIVFECSDDGRGVDLEAVLRAAKERGLIGAAAPASDGTDLMRVLLRGGISTSATVTSVSGRGVGLDVVREAVERLGGEVSFRTEPGRGTTFTLAIPPSLASMQALIVEVAGSAAPVAIPFDSVRSTLRISADQVSHGPSGTSILFDDKAIPFIPLGVALNGKPTPAGRHWTAAVIAGASGLAAIGVDRLLSTSGIVVRPLPEGMSAGPTVAGAALDADGNPQLVLDADALAAAAHRGSETSPKSPVKSRPVLVVDDSMTTRMLEKSILESAGHDVEVALSGEEALERVRDKRYGLILVDVEMPGMDGFTFIEHIRSNPSVRDIPAILVSSRAAPEDLKRGRDVGAQGYMIKSEFDQAALLSMIDRLMS